MMMIGDKWLYLIPKKFMNLSKKWKKKKKNAKALDSFRPTEPPKIRKSGPRGAFSDMKIHLHNDGKYSIIICENLNE